MTAERDGAFTLFLKSFGYAVGVLLVMYAGFWVWSRPALILNSGVVGVEFMSGSAGVLGDPEIRTHQISMNPGALIVLNVLAVTAITLLIWGVLLLMRVGERSTADR